MEQLTATTMENAQEITGCAVADFADFDALVLAEQRRIYFLKAYEQRKRFRGECSVRTWLMRIAINLARDHVKNRRWQFWQKIFSKPAASEGLLDPVEAVDPHASPERSLLARERLAHVSAVVENLPNQQRAVFVLRFLEEMSIEEIAQATSLRPGTVKAHLFRAVSAVREHLKERKNR
jgi:RNA polymerase sigma-70 factor (ECF subfamily)